MTEPTDVATELDLPLLKPVSFGPEVITTLHLTEPTMKQLREAARAGALGLDRMSKLIELNAKVLPAVVDELGQRDITRINDFFDRFDLQETPGPGSPA